MQRPSHSRTVAATPIWRQTGAVLVCCCALASRLDAGSGELIRLPLGGVAPKSGLQLVVDTRWVDTNGYRPVRVTAVPWPAGPALASRTLRVELTANLWRYGSNGTGSAVTGYVEIPEGATRGELTLAMPQTDGLEALGISVYEEGKLLKDLSPTVVPLNQRVYTYPSEAIPAILVIDTDTPNRDARDQLLRSPNASSSASASAAPVLPDLRQLPASLSPQAQEYSNSGTIWKAGTSVAGPADDAATLGQLELLPRIEVLGPAELPQRWIDYTCFDIIFVSSADLQTVAAQHPAVWKALREWLATGPTLCVYGMTLSAEELGKLESLLGVTALPEPAPAEGVRAGWRAPNLENAATDTVKALAAVETYYGPPTEPQSDGETVVPPTPLTPPAADQPPFLVRDVDCGRVVAMTASEPLLGGQYELPWVLNELGGQTWMWYQRHGMSLLRDNDEYWNWIVPGIGLTPVGTFLFLILLFCIGIGPVNYYLLRRSRRLYMLLVTVPVGAALVTAALFSYALICDGLGVRVRVRGLVEIDQRNGRTVSWSRQTYYAGLAPSEGLQYPEQTAVFPIELQPMDHMTRSRPARRLVWDGGQQLAAGYINSRSTAELLVIDSGPSDRGLRLVEGTANPRTLEVTNQLACTLDQLAVWDSTGQCFWAERVAAGPSMTMTPLTTDEAHQRLASMLMEHRPAFPEGFDNNFYDNSWGYQARYWSGGDGNLSEPTFATSIFERRIGDAIGPGAAKTVQPRTYLALSRTTPGVPLGHRDASEEASIYVIEGRW